jgi:ribosomal protein S27AE
VEFVVIAFFCGLSAGTIGKLKGSSFFIWFLVGAVLPLLGTIVAILYRFEDREPRRNCPGCGTVLPVHVQVCTACGRDLDFPDQVIPAR